jgi:drug/metabolite transporter (DMT)-like permease
MSLGALGNGLYQLFFVLGIARTRAGDTALLISASPAFMALIGRVRGTERTGGRGVLGIVLSLVGIALVVYGDAGVGHAQGRSPLVGDALILVACLCWSLYSSLVKPYTERVDVVSLSALTMVGGAIPMLVVAAPALVATPWSTVGVGAWSAVAFSGVLALVVAYMFWYRGVRVLGPTRAAMYGNLQPIIALGVAWATLGESPHLPQLAGAAFIMTGLMITRLSAPDTSTLE